jgi:tRNA pseudouridine38-40 synthase
LRTLRLTLAYDGTDFAGWQVQPDCPTVQGLVRDACARILGESVKLTGASRTDAGVHALRQVASFSTASSLDPARLSRALNALLPDAVRVLGASEAPAGFDARRSAMGKRYLYLIDRDRVAHPLLRRYAWHPRFSLDVDAMRSALGAIRGKHDFSAFCAAPGRGRTPTCTVRSARLCERGASIAIALSADSFLHHMVRNIVGSLVEVGRGAKPASWMADLLEGRDRTRSGPTAPAQGLMLVRVLYGEARRG